MRMAARQYRDTEVTLEGPSLRALLVVPLYSWKKEARKGLVIIDAFIRGPGPMLLVELLQVGGISFSLFALCVLALGISYTGASAKKKELNIFIM